METKQKKKAAPKPEPKNDNWEFKDRNYYLLGGLEPLTYTLPARHTQRYPLVYFDPERGYERELRYATNQKSVFVDEQKGPCTLKHIVFMDGVLTVRKEQQALQKLLSLYHPHKDRLYAELDTIKEAVDEIDILEKEIEAMNMAKDMEIDHAEAILRVELGSRVSRMSSKELRRDLLLFAKRNPILFLDLVNDDNVELRNMGIKAVEQNIIHLSGDQRTFSWATNKRKLMTVPFDENPYSALAAWFKTDEGMEVYRSIEKKLK